MEEAHHSLNRIFIGQLGGYVLAIFLPFCAAVPTILSLIDFNGHCLLFTNGTWSPATGQLVPVWGAGAFCSYNIAWPVVSVLAASLNLAFLYTYRHVGKPFLYVALETLVCVVLGIGALVGAVLTTLGFQRWCDVVTTRFQLCSDAAASPGILDPDLGIDPSEYYLHYGIIQFGVWVVWSVWAGLSLASGLAFCSQHQDYVIRVSMSRERARLVGGRGAYTQVR